VSGLSPNLPWAEFLNFSEYILWFIAQSEYRKKNTMNPKFLNIMQLN
jgi:hypothetical protein